MICSFFQVAQPVNPYELMDMQAIVPPTDSSVGESQARWGDMLLQMRLVPPSIFKLTVYKSKVQHLSDLAPDMVEYRRVVR